VEALADPVGLRALGFCSAVVDVLDGEVELVFVTLAAAELGAASTRESLMSWAS
jgi:hypothetical protein